jgi:excisionase family DNA binding protein
MSTARARQAAGTAEVVRLTYTVDEVAQLLSLSRGITYASLRDGTIPAERVGRRWVISRRRLHAWLDGLTDR